MSSTVNFTASFVKPAQVMKRHTGERFKPVKLSIVELDKTNSADMESLYRTSILWNEQGAKYSSDLYHDAIKGYEYDDIEKEHYYALTEQMKDFDKLDSEKVLGLMLFSKTKYGECDTITWLQVRPNTNTPNSWNREYKGVGKALIDLLKVRNYNKPIYVQSSGSAVEFYKKQGFVDSGENIKTCMVLEI